MNRPLVNRRQLLLGGLAFGAVAAIGSAIPLPLPAEGYEALSAGEAAIVAAIAAAMFPGAPFPLDGVEAGVVERVDRIVAHALPKPHASGFRYMLAALEWGTLAGRGRRFTQLDRVERTEVLQTWNSPGVLPRRVAFDALKTVMAMAYFAHPAVQAHMGWRSECGGGVS